MKLSTALILSAVVLCVSSSAFAGAGPNPETSECADALQPARIEKTHHWMMGLWDAAMDANRGVAIPVPATAITGEIDRVCAEQPGLGLAQAGQRSFLRLQAHERVKLYN